MEKLRRFLAFAAIITALNGVGYALIPATLLPMYGVDSSPGAIVGFRFFGAALVTFGLILWFVRKSYDWTALRGLLLGAAIGNVIGVAVSVWAILTGAMNGTGWLFVLTYVVLLVGYLYSLWAGTRKFAQT